jgi:hypothetical protein
METVEVAPPPVAAHPGAPRKNGSPLSSAEEPARSSVPTEHEKKNQVAPPASSGAAPAHPNASPVEGKAPGRGLANGRTYVGEVSVPDGGKIALEGIVYSESNPVALINGKVLPPGAVVEEFTIVTISPDRVELNGRGLTIFLALK